MPVKPYVQQVAGRLKQMLPTAVSTGAANGGDIVALTDAGVLDISMMPAGIGPTTVTIPATEAIGAGKLVNFYWNSGVMSARLADASTAGKRANGYAIAAASSGANVTVYRSGVNSQVSGLSGVDVYLATTPGGVTSTAPTGAGQLVQLVGSALSATSLVFSQGIDVENAPAQ